MAALRKEYDTLLNKLRECNKRGDDLVIQHNEGKINEDTFWKEMEKESRKSQEIRKRLNFVKKELTLG